MCQRKSDAHANTMLAAARGEERGRVAAGGGAPGMGGGVAGLSVGGRVENEKRGGGEKIKLSPPRKPSQGRGECHRRRRGCPREMACAESVSNRRGRGRAQAAPSPSTKDRIARCCRPSCK